MIELIAKRHRITRHVPLYINHVTDLVQNRQNLLGLIEPSGIFCKILARKTVVGILLPAIERSRPIDKQNLRLEPEAGPVLIGSVDVPSRATVNIGALHAWEPGNCSMVR